MDLAHYQGETDWLRKAFLEIKGCNVWPEINRLSEAGGAIESMAQEFNSVDEVGGRMTVNRIIPLIAELNGQP